MLKINDAIRDVIANKNIYVFGLPLTGTISLEKNKIQFFEKGVFFVDPESKVVFYTYEEVEDEYINGTEIKINKHDDHSLVRTRTEQLIVRFYPNHSDESPTATDKFLFHWNQQQIYMLNYKNIPLLSHDGIFLSIALNEQNPILFLRKRLDGIDLIVHLQGVRKNEWLDINDIVKINDQITVEIYDTQRNNDIIVNGVSLSQIIGNMIWNSIVSRGEMIANYSIKDSEHSSNIRLAMKYPNPKQSS